MDYKQYEEIINGIKNITHGKGLWYIEKYWEGHQ